MRVLPVDIPIAYNVFLGRPTLNAIKAVVTHYLLLVQFELDDEKVGKLYGDQKMAREYHYMSLKSLGRKEEPPSGKGEHGMPYSEPTSEVVSILLGPTCPERTVWIGKELEPPIKDEIVVLLK